MRTLCLFVMVVLMTSVVRSQTLPAPQAITDPKQISSKADARVEKNLSIEKLYMTRQVGGATWSPDGKTVGFVSNLSGRNNLWLVPSEGGWPVQLTVSDQRQTSPAWSPNGKWIAYTSDYEGDEQWDIFLVSPKTGQVVNITNTREIAEVSPIWSPDGRYLAYAVKPKTSSVFEIDVYDTVLRDVKHLTTGTAKDRMNVKPFWSADGKFIFYTQEQSKGTDSNIFMVEVASGESTLLTPHEGEKTYAANDVSPDGKHLLITSNAGNGYDNAGLLDIATKKIHWLTEDKWEIEGASYSPDGKFLTYTANVDGDNEIYLYDVGAGKAHAVPLAKGLNWPAGRPSPFTRDGSRMLYSHTGPTAPGDLWVYSISEEATKIKSTRAGMPAPHGPSYQLTHSLVGGVRAEDSDEATKSKSTRAGAPAPHGPSYQLTHSLVGGVRAEDSDEARKIKGTRAGMPAPHGNSYQLAHSLVGGVRAEDSDEARKIKGTRAGMPAPHGNSYQLTHSLVGGVRAEDSDEARKIKGTRAGMPAPHGNSYQLTHSLVGGVRAEDSDEARKIKGTRAGMPAPHGNSYQLAHSLVGGVRAEDSDEARKIKGTRAGMPAPHGPSYQLTHSLVGGVRAEDMVEPQLVHFPSTDGKWTISAFVYVPYNLPRKSEHPAIVYVHGGPTAQTMNGFNRFVQYMANQGYFVIAPNYRGSSGYGKEFQEANLFDMGGGDLQDVLAAAEWIKQTGYVDPKKVILMGGSYGGYLTMMGVTKAPEVWAAGVPIVPFVNWFTEIQNEDPVLQQSDLATMGDVVKNKARYEDRSPINFVDQIKAPLYLLAGGNDPRCPKSEAQQVVDAVKKRGGVVEYKVYENEGHGFAKVENQIDAYKRVADFLKARVPPADCSCALNE